MTTLFDPIKLGSLELPNRIIMAPLTRCRADEGRVPNALMAEYYVQRASAGLILSEATSVTPMGVGYPDTPGIWSEDQVRGWLNITRAVHANGGRIFLQLWHVGRISDPLYLNGELPVAPSAIQPAGHVSLVRPMKGFETPRALETEEIAEIVEAYRHGAENAKAAGFDGVEIHAANGYLLDQFLQSSTNQRSDHYGGSIENRARLLLEVTQSVVSAIGGERTGIRLSPVTPANDALDADPQPLFDLVMRELAPMGLAYVHFIEGATGGPREISDRPFDYTALQTTYRTAGGRAAWMVNNGYDLALSEKSLKEGADLVAFGKLFIANPDLVQRLKQGGPFNEPDRTTFYGGSEHGYTDYPALTAA